MDTKTVLIAVLLAASAFVLYEAQNSDSPQALYRQWKETLGAKFTEAEDIYRFHVFEENLARINAQNSKAGQTHIEGLNQFSFLTHKEFVASYLSNIETPKYEKIVQEDVNGPTVDWVSWGAVSPVKDHGSCGASYAFSAVAALEGLSAVVYKTQQELSAQQIVDCSFGYGNSGCATGTMTNTFSYVRDRGITTLNAYPWTGYLGSCRTASGIFRISGYSIVNPGQCDDLANALMAKPVSVAVDGNKFQFYSSGIFQNCGTNLSLAVTLVGMNDYAWTLKNSWGTGWGEYGYIRISRGNTCGVCLSASYPNPI